MTASRLTQSLLVLLACFPLTLHAGKLDEVRRTFSLTKCLLKQTQTICVATQLRKEADAEPMPSETEVVSRSKRFVVYPLADGWINDLPEKGEDEMLLLHPSGEAMIYAWWYEGKQDIYKEVALNPFTPMIEKGVEPERQELEVWPFAEEGDFQLLCYSTDKKTDECMISAAANMPHGTVHMLGVLHDDGSIFDEVVQTILSVDVPAPPE